MHILVYEGGYHKMITLNERLSNEKAAREYIAASKARRVKTIRNNIITTIVIVVMVVVFATTIANSFDNSPLTEKVKTSMEVTR